MKNNKKGFGVFGVIIAVAIIGIIAGGTVYTINKKSGPEKGPVPVSEQQLGVVDKSEEVKKIPEEINILVETKNINDNDWRIYKNEEYGFEIKYPLEWVIDRANNDKQVIFSVASEADIQNDFQFIIAIIDKEKLENMDEVQKDYIINKPGYSNAVIVNQQANKYEIRPQDTGRDTGNIQYTFVKDGSSFSLLTRYYKESDGIGEKIISTLKFSD